MADEAFTKADMDKAIADAVARVQESVDKLEAKNRELIGENRKLKSAGEIKPEDLQAAEERADKAEAALAEAAKQAKTLAGERDKAMKTLADEQGFTQKLLIEDGIKTALIANGVKDEDYIDSLTAKFTTGAAIVTEGEQRKAVYGDKPLGDFIKEWAGSDSGKKFIAAPANNGGGSQGSRGNGAAAKSMTRSAFEGLSVEQRMEFSKAGGTLTD